MLVVSADPSSLPHCLHKLSLQPEAALHCYSTHDNFTVRDDKVLTRLSQKILPLASTRVVHYGISTAYSIYSSMFHSF